MRTKEDFLTSLQANSTAGGLCRLMCSAKNREEALALYEGEVEYQRACLKGEPCDTHGFAPERIALMNLSFCEAQGALPNRKLWLSVLRELSGATNP